MERAYVKSLKCGCQIKSITKCVINSNLYLDRHQYKFICYKCNKRFSKDTIDERLKYICNNDFIIQMNGNNMPENCDGWQLT